MEIVTNTHPGFVIMQQDDAEIHCEVLFTFQDTDTGKTVVAFTDHSLDSNGNIRIYGAVQQLDTLVPIRTAAEKALMQEAIAEINRYIAQLRAD